MRVSNSFEASSFHASAIQMLLPKLLGKSTCIQTNRKLGSPSKKVDHQLFFAISAKS